MTKLGRPWSAQIELVEGCTRLCSFCGLNAIRDAPGNYKRMTISTAELTAAQLMQLNPEARIEFAMHGEPTMNPDGPAIIARFRVAMPNAQIMLTTNGASFRNLKTVQEKVHQWFAAGCDFIVVDTYMPERDEVVAALRTLQRFRVADFYSELAPAGWSPYHNHRGRSSGLVVLMDDIGERDGEHPSRVILNHAGSNPTAPVLGQPLQKTCTNPFREITVCWDGEVRICCMDWRGEYVCGNVHTQTLTEIWWGQAFEDARQMLQNRDRNFAPCSFCNKSAGPRAGLLPKYPPVPVEVRERVQARGAAKGAAKRHLRLVSDPAKTDQGPQANEGD